MHTLNAILSRKWLTPDVEPVSYRDPASTYSPTDEKCPGVVSVATRMPLGRVVICTGGSGLAVPGLTACSDLWHGGRRQAEVRREWTAARRIVVVGGRDAQVCAERLRADMRSTFPHDLTSLAPNQKPAKKRAHRGSNTGQHDLQSYALPLSYKPVRIRDFRMIIIKHVRMISGQTPVHSFINHYTVQKTRVRPFTLHVAFLLIRGNISPAGWCQTCPRSFLTYTR